MTKRGRWQKAPQKSGIMQKTDVKKGDLIVHFFEAKNGEEIRIHDTVSKVEKTIFGNTVIYYENNGKLVKFNEDNFAGKVRFFRKNEN